MSRTYSEPEKLLLRGMGLPLLAKVRYLELQGKNPYYANLDTAPQFGNFNKKTGSVPIRALTAPTCEFENGIVAHLLDCGLLEGDLDDEGQHTGHVVLTNWGREFVNGSLMNSMGAR